MNEIKRALVFVDYQNQPVDFIPILEQLNNDYSVSGVKAYWDWSKIKNKILVNKYYSLGIELVNLPEDGFPNNKKNDVKLIVDCIEALFIHKTVDTYVLITGDLDFFPLIMKLKEYGKEIVVIGRENSVSPIIKSVADRFISYDKLAKEEIKRFDVDLSGDRTKFYNEVIDYILLDKEENVTLENISRILNTIGLYKLSSSTQNGQNIGSIQSLAVKILAYFNRQKVKEKEKQYLNAYEHFLLRRLMEYERSGVKFENFRNYITSIQPWSPPNDMTLYDFINKLKLGRKVVEIDKNIYRVNPFAAYPFVIKESHTYKNLRDKFLKEVFNVFKETDDIEITTAVQDAFNKLNIKFSNKKRNFIGDLIKFSGLLKGPEDSDYVTLNIPVHLIKDVSFNDFVKSVDKALIKKLMAVYPLQDDELEELAKYIYGDSSKNNMNLLKQELEELLNEDELKLEDNIYYKV